MLAIEAAAARAPLSNEDRLTHLRAAENHLAATHIALQAALRDTINADGGLLCVLEDTAVALRRLRLSLERGPNWGNDPLSTKAESATLPVSVRRVTALGIPDIWLCPACNAPLPNDGSCCDSCDWVAPP